MTRSTISCRIAVLVFVAVTGSVIAAGSGATADAAVSSHAPRPPAAVTAAPTPHHTPVPSPAPSGIQLGPTPIAPVTTAPGPTTGTGTGGGQGGCGFFSASCHITHAINDWFRELVTSALNPVLSLLGSTVLATPDVTGGRVGQLWLVAAGIANSLLVLLVLAGAAVVMGHETLQTRYAAKDIAPRVVVAVIAANTSLAIVSQAIPVANALSAALLGQGVDPAQATAVLHQMVLAPLASGGIFLVLLGGVAAVLAVTLLASYVIRVALLVLLAAAAPLALIGHALPQTDGLARLWWRAVGGLFAIQVGQSLVLITALRVFFDSGSHTVLGFTSTGGLTNLLVACSLLWVLVKIPSWVSRSIFAGTGHRGSSMTRVVKDVVVYKAVRAGIAALA